MQAKAHAHKQSSGFTLMESIIVLLLLAMASTVIIGLNGHLFFRSGELRTWRQSAQLLQACTDLVTGIGLGKPPTVPGIDVNSCNVLNDTATNTTGLTLDPLKITDISNQAPCTGLGLTCKTVEISIIGTGLPVTLLLTGD